MTAWRALACLLVALASSFDVMSQSADPYAARRQSMLDEIRDDARATGSSTGRPVLSERVMAAMARVQRHEFVPRELDASAYVNRPLPIGEGQTISQPFVVALMTELLDLQPGQKVLEVGTGSGYQAAVLAELGAQVFSVEIVASLAKSAEATLARLGYSNVKVKLGDGYLGWPENAPFDAIIVTAAPEKIPPPLVQQLKRGGRMVIPVGGRFDGQDLLLVEKRSDDETVTSKKLPVRFVPLVRGR